MSLEAALMEAAAAGDEGGVVSLIKQKADAAYQADETGASALMRAAEAGSVPCCRAILEAGAPWNAMDRQGRCAGEYAMTAERQEAVDFLLDTGVRAELIFGAMDKRMEEARAAMPTNAEYLEQKLEYTDDGEKLMDADGEAVMMSWEGALMKAHAATICHTKGDVLNIGFGLGLVDTAIQECGPASHTIIEAHPDVHARMLATGWDKKPGVRIVQGRWQDVLEQLGQYDGIFFDTYGEHYSDMRELHNALPKLLKPGGVYSFFNGLVPDNAFFHAVYCQIVELEMKSLGLETQFLSLPIDTSAGSIWKGVKNRYWSFDTYFLPVCQKIEGMEDAQAEES